MGQSIQEWTKSVPYPVVSLGIPILWKGLYKQYLDMFKQVIVADTGIQKVFNSRFLSLPLKLNV